MIPVGVGPLELAYRQLYEKLHSEGLFDERRKRFIPRFAEKIGIVTSPTGAAVRDIIQIARRRNKAVELIVYPAQVQGDGAEQTIAEGIKYFNTRDDIDLLVIGRGGGSLEDLWPFNTEVTVRAVVESRIPVISAVGHEVDFTLSDYAADMRAPTPSAAAELAVWSEEEYRGKLRHSISRQTTLLNSQLKHARRRLSALLSRPVLARPMDMIHQRQQHLDSLVRLLVGAGKSSFERHKNRLSLVLSRLEALSPLKILTRGYTVSRRLPKHTLVGSYQDVLPGDRMETLVSDGVIVSFVEQAKKKKHGSQEEA
jgi:exodeoxyribonuclease VII large subunit